MKKSIAFLAVLATVSCGEDDPAGPAAPRAFVASVSVSPSTATLSAAGDTLRLTARALDGQGNAVAGAEFSWASSDGSVLSVDPGGLVTAVRGGTARVTAREGSSGLSATALLVVAAEPHDALLAIHRALGGGGWTRRDNWGTDAPLGTWYGVTTDEQGRVVELDLSDNGLAGSIPPALARLETLVVLDLSVSEEPVAARSDRGRDPSPGRNPDASFDLTLDPGLDRHPEVAPRGRGLAGADASARARQEITGSIPPALGTLSRLRTLNLSGNGLTGPIPRELGRLSQLDALDLGRNALSGPIPPALADLSRLSALRLQENSLTGPVPPELGSLVELRALDLAENDLSGSIPPELGNLPNLRELYLTRNDLTGSIPSELGNLQNLTTLWLGRNELTGPIPPELANIRTLEDLYLWSNDLTGPIPLELVDLPNLRDLWLSWNHLTGSIPPELGNVSTLEALVLLGNDLTGRIPPELGNLSNLWGLSVSDNHMTGPIPPELGNLTNLTQLSVSRNRLTGPIPVELTALSKFEKLWLYLNDLTGPIPPGLGELSALDLLSLSHNELSGPIPSSFGGLTSLEYLNVTANAALSGALPAELSELELLETLLARGTGLCAPADADFQTWLRSLEDGQVVLCDRSEGSQAYLTQTVQSLDFPVPLVAGRQALLRVFVTAAQATDAGIPAVLATFHRGGEEVHRATIPSRPAPIPTAIDEGALSLSANALIPGRVVQPGLRMVVEIDPNGRLDPGLGVTRRIPETGRVSVDVREMPVLDLTVIPFLLQDAPDRSILEITDGLTGEDALLSLTRTLLPVADLDVSVHEPVWTSSDDSIDLLRETAMIRTMEGGRGHYMGTIPMFSDRVGGRAYVANRASVAIPDSSVIAHEFGHNMSLRHAPCGRPDRVDASFPNAAGKIGAWGYDFTDQTLRPPGTPDLMSYCHPRWIGDYGFTKALRYRLEDEAGADAGQRVAPTPSLLLWGGVDDRGAPFLEPAFVVEAPPRLPGPNGPGGPDGPDGPYEVRGTAPDGDELFSIRFDMWPAADGNGGSDFVMVLPLEPAWTDGPAEIRLTGPEGSAVLDARTDQPMAILRDPANGQVRGILRGAPPSTTIRQDLASAVSEPGLEVLFSRGLPDDSAPRR